jgi:hypothetical protein
MDVSFSEIIRVVREHAKKQENTNLALHGDSC